MREVLTLARRTKASTTQFSSAALLVRDGIRCGSAFGLGAEPLMEMIAEASSQAPGTTLVANVWCEEAASRASTILQPSGIARLVLGMMEPGASQPEPFAQSTTRDVLLEQCWDLAAGVLVARSLARPLVVAKMATSIDGRIATRTGSSQWITGSAARRRGHELRRDSGAIVVGAGTVRADDPRLTTRLADEPDARHPLRVVISTRPMLPPGAKLRDTSVAATVIFHSTRSPGDEHALRTAGVETVLVPGRRGLVDPDVVLADLFERGISRVLLEGGGELIGTFADAGLIDRVIHFQAPLLVGGTGARACLAGKGVAEIDRARRGVRARAVSCGADLEITTDFLSELVPQSAGTGTGTG